MISAQESDQNRYKPVTVRTRGDFIVLPHWDIHKIAGTMPQYPTQSNYPCCGRSGPKTMTGYPTANSHDNKFYEY